MEGHTLGQMMRYMQRIVKGMREKFQQRSVAPAQAIDPVGPVDQQAAPDHDGQHREVDPVEPARG